MCVVVNVVCKVWEFFDAVVVKRGRVHAALLQSLHVFSFWGLDGFGLWFVL